LRGDTDLKGSEERILIWREDADLIKGRIVITTKALRDSPKFERSGFRGNSVLDEGTSSQSFGNIPGFGRFFGYQRTEKLNQAEKSLVLWFRTETQSLAINLSLNDRCSLN